MFWQLVIGNWALGNLGIQNNVMICLNDNRFPVRNFQCLKQPVLNQQYTSNV